MRGNRLLLAVAAVAALICSATPLSAQNQVLGKIAFVGRSKVERTSGVWVDGQYVGFIEELKGNKWVMLLPGEHEVSVRQSGYTDFSQKVVLEPGQTQVVHVSMKKAAGAVWLNTTTSLKLDVQPGRAAVFVDGAFVGHAGEFGGALHAMLISPGRHQVTVELPGYQTFETELNLREGQKAEVKTELLPGSIEQAGSLVKQPSADGFRP